MKIWTISSCSNISNCNFSLRTIFDKYNIVCCTGIIRYTLHIIRIDHVHHLPRNWFCHPFWYIQRTFRPIFFTLFFKIYHVTGYPFTETMIIVIRISIYPFDQIVSQFYFNYERHLTAVFVLHFMKPVRLLIRFGWLFVYHYVQRI